MRMAVEKEWRYRGQDPDLAGMISSRLGISRLASRIMVARGIYNSEEAYDFIHPTLRSLHDPFLLPDMERAVDRISEALESREGIIVHGDYDADGITATALVVKSLRGNRHGSPISYYLPSRFGSGYGLSDEGIDRAVESGSTLLLTVDCGITASEGVKSSLEKGVDVIVTDHHEPEGGSLPEAIAVVNPKRDDSTYPFRELAGVGVAFKLIWALQMRGLLDRDVREMLDLVALGTIGDVVPLVDENRILVSKGLEQLENTDMMGLRALMREARIDPFHGVRSMDVSFRLIPCINAAGRLGHPDLALELLLTEDRVDADLFSRELNALNFKRQAVGRKLAQEVASEIEKGGRMDDPILVLAGEEWHQGVLGIAAARFVEETGKPTIVLAIDGDTAKGSARSPQGFNLIMALENSSRILEEWGGHEKAAGLTIRTENIDLLRSELIEYFQQVRPVEGFAPTLEIDLDLSIDELSVEEIEDLSLLEPHGTGNPRPMVSLREACIDPPIQAVGGGKHLKFTLRDESAEIGSIWFGRGELVGTMGSGEIVNVAGYPGINRWGGRKTTQLTVEDLHVL